MFKKMRPVSKKAAVYSVFILACFIVLFVNNTLAVDSSRSRQLTDNSFQETGNDSRIVLTLKEQNYLKAKSEITVSNEFDWPPFDFAISGKPMGFGIDLMRLLAQKAGIQMTFINGYSWDQLVEMFFNGEIDVIHSLSETPERQKKALFSPPYYHSKNVLIYRRDSFGLNQLEDLEGKIISLPKGWSSIEFFKKYYPKVHIVEVDSSRKALEYVDLGKVEATVEQEGIAAYFIKKFGFSDLKMTKWIENEELQKTSSMHFAVLKSDPILFGILEKALSIVTPSEIQALEQKWFGRTGIKIGQEDVGLTPDELIFLENKNEIRYAISPDRMPFEANHQDGVIGMTSDLMEMFSERLDIPFRMVPTVSWSESLYSVKTGLTDLLPMISITADRKKYLDFTSPYLTYSVAIIVKDDYPFITGMGNLLDKKVGIVSDTNLKDLFLSHYPETTFLLNKNAKQCLLDISSGKIEAGLLSLPVASHYIRSLGLTNLKIAGQIEFPEEIRVGVHKENLILHSIMSKLVRSIPQNEIDAIYQKWVVLEFDHKFDYTILWKILAIVAIILLVIMAWNRKLIKLNSKIAMANRELKEKGRELEKISITDSLTRIFNRRHLDTALETELQRAKRYKHTLSTILIDIDYFKAINDEFGHQGGDKVLETFAQLLKNNIRKTDTVGRWGGEEFLIICPEISIDNAFHLAQALRLKIETIDFEQVGQRTASFGVSEYQSGDTKEMMVSKADKALYEAKENGRNRVEKWADG